MEAVARDRKSREFWWQTASLAGLLHDVGHGPWSHTFEYLELTQDFSSITREIPGIVGEYFRALEKSTTRLRHEELSVVYVHKILSELKAEGVLENAERFFLPVTLLINRKMATGKHQKKMEAELQSVLSENGYEGGIETHRLLRPIISGPFDVDRMDYIQRDGRNCGVNIGGIEWKRIVTKLIPCLAKHKGAKDEPGEVVLISNIKNQHVLDDFIFSLFQMYAQVYMHPKIVGVEEIAKRLLAKKVTPKKGPKVTFELHSTLTDDKFRAFLKDECGVPELERILQRRPGSTFHVARYPAKSGAEGELKKNGFTLIDTLDRPMMKDSMGLFLFSTFKGEKNKDDKHYFLKPWAEVSPIAQQFFSIKYSPKIWLSYGNG